MISECLTHKKQIIIFVLWLGECWKKWILIYRTWIHDSVTASVYSSYSCVSFFTWDKTLHRTNHRKNQRNVIPCSPSQNLFLRMFSSEAQPQKGVLWMKMSAVSEVLSFLIFNLSIIYVRKVTNNKYRLLLSYVFSRSKKHEPEKKTWTISWSCLQDTSTNFLCQGNSPQNPLNPIITYKGFNTISGIFIFQFHLSRLCNYW